MGRYLCWYIFLTVILARVNIQAQVVPEQSHNILDILDMVGNQSSRTLIDKAWGAVKNERYDSALVYYTIVASRYNEDSPQEEIKMSATASVNVGYIWLAWRMNGTEAYPWLMNARDIAKRHKLPEVEIGVNSNLGQLYFNYGNIPKALMYLHEGLRGVTAVNADIYFTPMLLELATVGILQSDYPVLRESVESLKTYVPKADTPQKEYAEELIKALEILLSGDPKLAAMTLEGAYRLLKMDTDSKRYQAMHHFITGKMWNAAGRDTNAIAHYKKMVATVEDAGYYNLAEKGCLELSKSYAVIDLTDSAGFWQNRMIQIRDSLFNVVSFESVKDQAIADELATLTSEVKVAENRASNLYRRLLWISVAALVVTAITMWIYLAHRKLKGTYRELYLRNLELIKTSSSSAVNISDETSAAENEVCDEKSEQEATRHLFTKIEEVMRSSSAIYSVDFSLEALAEIVGDRPRVVSKSINIMTGKNFATFLGEYRIREACRRLTDTDTLRTMKIESIAEGVGYRSRTYFSKLFKDVTGLTPSQFIAQAKDDTTQKS